MKMVKGIDRKPYQKWLRSLGSISLEKKTLRGHLTAVYNFLTRGKGGAGGHLISLVTIDRT